MEPSVDNYGARFSVLMKLHRYRESWQAFKLAILRSR